MPLHASVMEMQINSHSHHKMEYSRIIPNPQIQF